MAYKKNNFKNLVSPETQKRRKLQGLLTLNACFLIDNEYELEQIKVLNTLSWAMLKFMETGKVLLSNEKLNLIFNYEDEITQLLEQWRTRL